MGLIKEAKHDSAAKDAARARAEGRTVFVYQIRGAMSHTPKLSRNVADAAEIIEGIESQGWRLDMQTGLVYDNNITLVCTFRLAPQTSRDYPPQTPVQFQGGYRQQ